MTLVKKILGSVKIKKVKHSKYAIDLSTLNIEGKKTSVYAANPELKSNVRLVKR